MLVLCAGSDGKLNYKTYVFQFCIIIIVADVDECKTPGTCNGICHNTKGSQYCTECPSNTVYDIAIKMCTSTKKQNLVLGELYGTTNSM
jgi:hypothetical protein